MKEPIVNTGGRTGSQAQHEAGAEERRKERKEKVKAKFGSASQDVVRQEGSPGPFSNDFRGDALQIP
jgi:hypothetical protein